LLHIGKVAPVHSAKSYSERRYSANHSYPLPALNGGEWSVHGPTSLPKRKELPLPITGDWLGPRACLDVLEMREVLPLPVIEQGLFGRPACRLTASDLSGRPSLDGRFTLKWVFKST
jgi:hypothetical protein